MPSPLPFIFLVLSALSAGPLRAVLFDATDDPTFNLTAPTGALADSGWQYQGIWNGNLGTPIAPHYFITAAHVNGAVGDELQFQGESYRTTAMFTDPLTDLRIWRVEQTFTTYAPLYRAGDEVGRALVVIGRGTERGVEVRDTNGLLRGWEWGLTTGRKRWGTNVVSRLAENGTQLAAAFDHIGGTEAHLSDGDSGGAIFIQDPVDNVWKLAGIAYSVTGRYALGASSVNAFNASLFDHTGYFEETLGGSFIPTTPGPGEFFATRISARLGFIDAVIVPEPGVAAFLLMGMAGLAGRRRRSGSAARNPRAAPVFRFYNPNPVA